MFCGEEEEMSDSLSPLSKTDSNNLLQSTRNERGQAAIICPRVSEGLYSCKDTLRASQISLTELASPARIYNHIMRSCHGRNVLRGQVPGQDSMQLRLFPGQSVIFSPPITLSLVTSSVAL